MFYLGYTVANFATVRCYPDHFPFEEAFVDQYGLRLFLELSESLHFGRTSRRCNISPSALSRTIQRLEEEVGETLFLRDNRTVTLTRAGVLFREYAIQTLDKWEELKEQLRYEGTNLQGEISLYCSVTACYSILPEIIRQFRESHPGIHLKIQTGDAASAIKRVTDSEVDIAIAAKPDALPRELEFREVTTTPLVFIAPSLECETSKFMCRSPLPWKSIPMILPEEGLARKRADSWFREKGIKPLIYAQVTGNEAILAMVRLGCGVGVVPGLVLEKSPIKTDIRIVSVQPDLTPYTVGLVAKKKRKASPLVNAFWNTPVGRRPGNETG